MVLGLLMHVTPTIFFRRILRSEALVYKSFFFSERPFYVNYSTLDSHTNTVICHAFASRWRRKPRQSLLKTRMNWQKEKLSQKQFMSESFDNDNKLTLKSFFAFCSVFFFLQGQTEERWKRLLDRRSVRFPKYSSVTLKS